jgi:hypothetical protein
VRQPIDDTQTFVLSPLQKIAPTDASLAAQLARNRAASSATQASWKKAFVAGRNQGHLPGGHSRRSRADDGPKPLHFLEDGQYFSNVATADHLTRALWGVMNETGGYPGQPWL